MIGRSLIIKNAKNFLNTMQNELSENSILIPQNCKKTKIFHSEVNDHVYFESKLSNCVVSRLVCAPWLRGVFAVCIHVFFAKRYYSTSQFIFKSYP